MKVKVFGCFFAILIMLSNLFGVVPGTIENVYAEPEEQPAASTTTCEDSLGSLGWLVCPSTGKISEAVDFLYDKIEDILVINPVERKDGSPVYEIWKYFQGATNTVFVIFLMVVILSQISGVGINNYGIKKILPKLIIAAILVNLSFYICSLAVDVSNIFGSSLRGLFESIEASTSGGISGGALSNTTMSEVWASVGGGLALTIGAGVVAFETGAIWMLIPLALGALVSVVIGLITIAMRQAVVTLLIMIAPLAIVAYMLPNTEQWFRKWRHLLFQMLIFYPAFSLLFGASNIAGWAIIISADSGFGVLIGIAVQIFPLFFSWSLMKMSGTVLGTINSKLTGLTRAPLGGVKGWASSHRELSRQKHLASKNTYTPSMKLQKYLSDRKIAREEETREHAETVRNRGLAYAAQRNYKRGTEIPSKEGEEAYEAQARNAEYQRTIMRHKNNMNKGLGQLEAVIQNGSTKQKARLDELDGQNVLAFDALKMEQSRGERIDYKNAMGYHDRMDQAMNAHMDNLHRNEVDKKTGKPTYRPHFAPGSRTERMANDRYTQLSNIMEGDLNDAQYAAASAAYGYDTQRKIVASKMQKYMELTPPTKDVVNRIEEMTKNKNAAADIDAIISGLKVINSRGDTDIVKEQIDNILDTSKGGGVELGTHASQELASFLMFDVKDSDPWLRRFGKYINLETANVFNKADRKNLKLTYEEYIKGYHYELDEATGELKKMWAKKGMKELMEGTSLDNIERTALSNFDESLKKAYSTFDGQGNRHLDVPLYLKKREEVQEAIGPQFISASLKYLSGSEQLTNAVSFLTGYEHKQQKNNGEVVIDPKTKQPLYKWEDVWSKENVSEADKAELKNYFNKKTLKYIEDQTPSQILALRSDYKTPLLNHLADAYEHANTEDWSDEYVLEHEDYMRELAEIQTRYGDLPPEQAKVARDRDIAELKTKFAGAQFRQLLDKKGKLNQIYRTRRSGAANNAKDWLRQWLDLDNEVAITMKLEKDKRKEKAEYEKAKRAEQAKRDEQAGDLPAPDGKVYSDVDMADFVSHIDDMWHNLRSEDDDVFYNESLDYIRKTLSADSYIAKKYERFRQDDPYADSHMLKEYLESLLNDPDNY